MGRGWWRTAEVEALLGINAMRVKRMCSVEHELPYWALPGGERAFDPEAIEAYRDGYRWMRIREAADSLRVSTSTFERLEAAGLLPPAERSGRVRLYRPEDVAALRDRIFAGEFDASDLCEDDLPSVLAEAERTGRHPAAAALKQYSQRGTSRLGIEVQKVDRPVEGQARTGRPRLPSNIRPPDPTVPPPRRRDAPVGAVVDGSEGGDA